ncbi:hypothetical protein X777_03566 [Ooceraea biroi]|uniref:Uncharacterized protein n=1 Tax=Ooceraea biroi TaxID=2015173 RepID=A0A026VV32_OOCBI|nr:hypothetical protein X777_03566 [Ooceraea biroi]
MNDTCRKRLEKGNPLLRKQYTQLRDKKRIEKLADKQEQCRNRRMKTAEKNNISLPPPGPKCPMIFLILSALREHIEICIK